MKRRKKLWIACAALAVVGTLCALALLSRPVPYRFLEGSYYQKTQVVSGRGLGPETVVRSYRVRGTMDSVEAKALAELRRQDGWKHWRADGGMQFLRGDDRVVVVGPTTSPSFTEKGRFPDVPGTILVCVVDEPTPFDRFLHWFRRL